VARNVLTREDVGRFFPWKDRAVSRREECKVGDTEDDRG